MGSPKVRTIDPAETYEKNLNIQLDKAEELFESESNPDYGRSAYAKLDLKVLRDVLVGSEEEPGLLNLYEKEIMPQLSAADSAGNTISREADIADVARLGPQAREAFRTANPESTALLDELNKQALNELQAGSSLPPGMAREVEQSVRNAQAARGFGYGQVGISEEALIKGLTANNLMRQRQQFGQSMVNLNNASSGDAFLQILGRPGVGVSQGAMISGQGQTFNPGDVFNPESQMLTGLAVGNTNAFNSAQVAKANNRAGLIGGVMSMGGLLGGGYLAGKK